MTWAHLGTACGSIATVIALVMWFPQARLTWINRHDPQALSGLSVGTLALLATNSTLWNVYGFTTGAWLIGVPGWVNAPLAVWNISMVLRARRRVSHLARPAAS